jgi:WD40 repeat protein
VSPISATYLTAGAWSNTRPAVLFIAGADGQILVWDFTDSSFRPSIELKATHSKIASMEFLPSTTASRHQLLAVGDDQGTLHIFEVPRNLTRPVHKEESIMSKFLERELQVQRPVLAVAYTVLILTDVTVCLAHRVCQGGPCDPAPCAGCRSSRDGAQRTCGQ